MNGPNANRDNNDSGATITGTIDDLVRDLLQESDETARLYLRESWIASVIALLRDTRREAGLTQHQLADRLGIKQPAIARLEAAENLKLTTLWDYLAACGQAPADIQAIPIERVRSFALADPAAPRTAQAIEGKKLRWIMDTPLQRRAFSVEVSTLPSSYDSETVPTPGARTGLSDVAA